MSLNQPQKMKIYVLFKFKQSYFYHKHRLIPSRDKSFTELHEPGMRTLSSVTPHRDKHYARQDHSFQRHV